MFKVVILHLHYTCLILFAPRLAGLPSAHILSHFRLGWASFADHAPVLLADVAVELARLCRDEAETLEKIAEVLVSGFCYENEGNRATKKGDMEWKR